MRYVILLFIVMGTLAPCFRATAQVSTIVSGEYFFDTDPGFGAGTPLPAFTQGQNVEVSLLAASSGLTVGMHTLGVRVFDTKNLWSMPVYTPVYVLASDPASLQNITGAEYFFGTDPGAGNATPIAVGTPGAVVDISFLAASSGLSTGMHILGVRVQNTLGEWGIPMYTPVYVDRDLTITKLEYFFDSDPGVGSGTQIDVTPDTDVLDAFFDMDSSPLPAGTHTLNVRVAGQNDFWGMTETVSFVICAAASPSIVPDVVCEGGITTLTDNSIADPGDLYAWDFESDGTVDDNTAGTKTFTYPAAGTYTATLSIDRGGCIATTTATVTIDAPATASVSPDQSICETSDAALTSTVGGAATGGAWTTSGDGGFDNATAANALYTPGAADITAGAVTLTLTTDDPAGACPAAAASTVVTIDSAPLATAGADQDVCSDGSALLAGGRAGAASASSWSTSGDGAFDDPNLLAATYIPGPGDLAAGTTTLTLTTDDPPGACNAASDGVVLTFYAVPTVDAGPDVSICGNAIASLSGMIGGTPTSYTWSTAGDGMFDNAGNLSAIYTPGSGDIVGGSIVLTLTTDVVGPCAAQSDQCVVTVTKDITLAVQSSGATIGNTVSLVVTAGGTFNPGDVLTSSIIAGPQKGTASLGSGHTLDYVANTGTVGSDTVYVQVCNQCNQCDVQYVSFSIANGPPVIDIPPASTPAGGSVVVSILSSVSDPNANIDPSTASIISPPSSGATATIDASYNLVLDYATAPNFTGTDYLTIEVCDDLGACAQHVLAVQVTGVSGEVVVYNAVAPNSSGDNRFMRILNLPSGNTVVIYNRWGDKVFEVSDYDHNDPARRFEGKNESGTALPSGVYFYRIEIRTADELLTGYLSLRQ